MPFKSPLRAILAIILLCITLTFASLNLCLDAYAQQLETRNSKPETGTGTEGVWKSYRYVDGLADNYVWALMQDKEGNIWFGTDGGVSRFDGVNWETYTQKDGLATNGVRAIMQDKAGNIWVGTGGWLGTYGGGVSRFDGKSWKTYTKEDGLAGSWIYAIIQDKEGKFWVGGQSGVNQFDGRCFQTIDSRDGLAHDNAVCLYMDGRRG